MAVDEAIIAALYAAGGVSGTLIAFRKEILGGDRNE
jgi:hypothetical protein